MRHIKRIGPATASQLGDDLREVLSNAEDLVKATASMGGARLAAARAKFDSTLRVVQARMGETQEALLLKAKAERDAFDAYSRENPWKVAGLAIGAGAIVGLLIARAASSRVRGGRSEPNLWRAWDDGR